MLRLCCRNLLKAGMVKPFLLVKPASATLVAGRNLIQQNRLPSPPVPPLQQSCELYLSFLEPFMEVDEAKRVRKIVEEFQKAGGVGETLQGVLEREACNTDNWMTDDYVKTLYLGQRKPLVIFSNIGGAFPRMDFRDKKGQIRCAADLIAAALDVKTMIDNETLPVDYMRGRPMCMQQYKDAMSCSRIPGLKTDSVEFYTHKHITVVHNCQFFVLEVYNSDGTVLTVDQLCAQLERICNASLQTNMEPVGILTSEHRDRWSKAYINLMKDKTNKEAVLAIQSSIFTVCLDGAMPRGEMYHRSARLQLMHGGGSQWNSGNRWFDKGLQFIIGEDGSLGSNSMHANADGSVIISICAQVVAGMKKPRVKESLMEALLMPQKLYFNITPEIKKNIEEAKQHIDKLAQDFDLRTAVFDHFGKNFLKANNTSPDAFVQMALQLANYRIHQQFCPILEPVSLRFFIYGRIGSVNTTSSATAAFVKAFDDPKKQNSEKVDLLDKAVKAHLKCTNMAIIGQDIENYFSSLKNRAIEENISMPEIFTDCSFVKAFEYGLSASHVTSYTGYGPCPSPERTEMVALCYSINKNHIELSVSAFTSNTCKECKAAAMIRALEDAMLDMRTLLEQTSRAQ